MKSPRAAAIDKFMKFLHKSETDRALPKQEVETPAEDKNEDLSAEALEALQSLTREG